MSLRKDGFSIEDVSCKDDASVMVGKSSTDADRYLYGRSVDGASDCRESLPCDRSASAGPEISLSKSATDVSETLTCNRSSAGPETNRSATGAFAGPETLLYNRSAAGASAGPETLLCNRSAAGASAGPETLSCNRSAAGASAGRVTLSCNRSAGCGAPL